MERYKTAPAEQFGLKTKDQDLVITQKELADQDYDRPIGIGPAGWGYKRSEAEQLAPEVLALKHTLEPVAREFSAANNGQDPTDPSQLLPYLKTDEQRAALQKALELRNARTATNN